MIKEIAGIKVEIQRKSVKHLRLSVSSEDGSVRVSAPRFLSEAEVEAFVTSKLAWIVKHRARAKEQRRESICEYRSGDSVPLFGVSYPLRVEERSEDLGCTLSEGEILLRVPVDASQEKRKEILDAWYRQCLAERAKPLFVKWQERTALHCRSWQIRDMKTRWGSCTVGTGRIRINLRLATLPPDCLEYVILHELLHLRVAGHGRDFYDLLRYYMPDYGERIKGMKDRR